MYCKWHCSSFGLFFIVYLTQEEVLLWNLVRGGLLPADNGGNMRVGDRNAVAGRFAVLEYSVDFNWFRFIFTPDLTASRGKQSMNSIQLAHLSYTIDPYKWVVPRHRTMPLWSFYTCCGYQQRSQTVAQHWMSNNLPPIARWAEKTLTSEHNL